MRKNLLRIFAVLLVILWALPVSADEQTGYWTENPEVLEDYAFTIAFVGDTQTITRHHPEELHKMYSWLAENRDPLKLQLVAGLGDITDTDSDEEWWAATDALRCLRGQVPYTLVRGNHDSTINFSSYLEDDHYIQQFTGIYNDDIYSTYYTFSVSGVDYLMLNLDFGPTDSALRWANNVVKAHPHHNVIVVTHAYMDAYGVLLSPQTSPYAPTSLGGFNDGIDIWNEFVRFHENIVMVVCGHISYPVIAVHETTGDKGNKIQQVLIDPQEVDRVEGPGGYVALFHFSADGKTVQVQNYATLHGKYFGNTLRFNLETKGGTVLPDAPPVVDEPEPETPPVAAATLQMGGNKPSLTILWLVLGESAAIALMILLTRLFKKPNQ